MYLIELSNSEEERNEVLGYVDSKKLQKKFLKQLLMKDMN